MKSFVCKLYQRDSFSVNGAEDVNLNDSSVCHYTLWNPKDKMIYATPRVFSKEALDLFYIALMVFYADRKIKRDSMPDTWTREIEIYMPVLVKDKWDNLTEVLEKALNFLTGDIWHFHFRHRFYTDIERRYYVNRKKFRKSIKWVNANTVCMLSGGLDSFIGAIDLLKQGEKPLFVGNYNGGKGVRMYQNNVISLLQQRYNVNSNRFYRFYAAPLRGKEDTTRSRSMMFFAHAILIASGMGHDVNLCIPENGVISLNIPLTIHRIGSLSTRTTHPFYMSLLQKIVDELSIPVKMYNPYQFKTKGEMMVECKDWDFLKDNYQWTMSCSHPDLGRWRGESGSSHCGVCLPCTIRRAAIKRADLDDASIYRDGNYTNKEAKTNLKSYKLGLSKKKLPKLAIHQNGRIYDHFDEYAAVYERGMAELKAFIDTI